MKNFKIKHVIVFAIIGILISCNDDNLEESNPNQLSASSFWKDLGDTNIGLSATYNALYDADILNLVTEAMRVDEGWPGYGRPQGITMLLPFYQLNYSNSSAFVQNKWNACYEAILRANQVITALENIEDAQTTEEEQEQWLNQMAQARFIRGLMHFYVHTAYNDGSVIIRDRVPETQEDFNKPLSSSEEVQAFFRKDLEYAYNNLPVSYEDRANDLGRVTRGAAAINLGMGYLYDKNYQKAMVYFDDLINNVTADYGYELVYDTDLLFTNAGAFNKESIFELNYSIDFREEISVWSDDALSNQLARSTASNLGPMIPAWLINTYKKDPIDTLDDRNYYDDPDSGRTIRPVNLRTSSMIAIVDDDVSLRYGQTTGANVPLSRNGWGFGMYKKYTNHDIYTTEGGGNPRGDRASGKNVVINRLGEVYLMQAECMIKTGNIPAALELINSVRHRWALVLLGSPNSKWSSSSFDNEVYDEQSLMEHLMFIEKPLETCLEGHQTRWNDLRRWGILESRFQNLSDETYYAQYIDIKNIDGETIRKWDASIVDEITPNVRIDIDLNTIDYEYDEKAANYDSTRHDYLPLPLSEITSNTNINQ